MPLSNFQIRIRALVIYTIRVPWKKVYYYYFQQTCCTLFSSSLGWLYCLYMISHRRSKVPLHRRVCKKQHDKRTFINLNLDTFGWFKHVCFRIFSDVCFQNIRRKLQEQLNKSVISLQAFSADQTTGTTLV